MSTNISRLRWNELWLNYEEYFQNEIKFWSHFNHASRFMDATINQFAIISTENNICRRLDFLIRCTRERKSKRAKEWICEMKIPAWFEVFIIAGEIYWANARWAQVDAKFALHFEKNPSNVDWRTFHRSIIGETHNCWKLRRARNFHNSITTIECFNIRTRKCTVSHSLSTNLHKMFHRCIVTMLNVWGEKFLRREQFRKSLSRPIINLNIDDFALRTNKLRNSCWFSQNYQKKKEKSNNFCDACNVYCDHRMQ